MLLTRTFVVLFMTDPATGFFYENYNKVALILTAISFLAIILISVISIFSSKKKMAPPMPNNFLGISQIMLGVCSVVEPFFTPEMPITVTPILNTLRNVFIILCGLVFIYFGFLNFLGKKPKYGFSVVLIFSYLIRLLTTFICYNGMSNIVANIYEILFLCSFLLFLQQSGKANCNIINKKTIILSNTFCVTSFMLAVACSVPQIIGLFLNTMNLRVSCNPIFTTLFTAIYVLSFLISKPEQN